MRDPIRGWQPELFEPRRDHILALDGLRGLAVLLVLWGHLSIDAVLPVVHYVDLVLHPAGLGVDVFFVLSGFLITRLLLSDRLRRRPLLPFLMRRILRIFPIYYLTIIVMAFIAPGMYLVECAAYLSNYTFAMDSTPNPLRHTWSLAVEEHFYLIWPLFVYLLSLQGSRFVALVVFPLAAFSCAALTCVMLPDHDSFLIYRGSVYRAFSLAIGASMAYHEAAIREKPARAMRVAIGLLLVGGGLLALDRLGLHQYGGMFKVYGYSLVAAMIVLFGIALGSTESPARRMLENGALRYVGRISYGIYLYHFPICYSLGLLTDQAENVPMAIVLGASLSIGVASLSFWIIERPILKLKDRFR